MSRLLRQVAKAEARAKILEDLDENCKLKTDGSKEFRSRIRRSATQGST